MKEIFTGIIEGERWSVLKCGDYAISDHGRVMKTVSGITAIGGKILRHYVSRGHCAIKVGTVGNRERHIIHRLVAEHFIGPLPKDSIVHHNNGNTQDNVYTNLSILQIRPDPDRRRQRAESRQRREAMRTRFPESIVFAARLANRTNANPIRHDKGLIDGERWEVLGCEHYAVSTFGRVMRTVGGRGTYAGKLLKARITSTGYVQFVLLNRIHMLAHRLVAEAFIGPEPDGMQVNHIDGVKTNNHVSNLEYVTPSQNVHHAIACGFTSASNSSDYIESGSFPEEWI